VLSHAVEIASVDGLGGLTIGRLADATGHSKSGVATLFGSKEQLQLAAVAAASEIFVESVIAPARADTGRGLDRVCALIGQWLSYSERRVFAGGCFFSAVGAEFDAKPGAVRDAIVSAYARWEDYLTASIEHARVAGELPGLDDARQLAFEIDAYLEAANSRSLMYETAEPYERAVTAVRSRLLALGADPAIVELLARPVGNG